MPRFAQHKPELNKTWLSNASLTALLSSSIFFQITSNVLTLPCNILFGRQETRHGMAPRRLVSHLVIYSKWLPKIFIQMCGVIALWREHVTLLTTSTTRFLKEIMFFFKTINPILKGHMTNRILHSWSFHMKFMKLAEGHMKWPWV